MPGAPGMITLKEIAERANVSIGTVDRVLHDRGKVAPDKELKIRRILKELNYKPNPFARNLVLRKSFRFCVLMPRADQDSGYWKIPVKGIERAQRELHGQKVNIEYYFYDKFLEESFAGEFDRLLDSKPDGLLIAPVLSRAAGQMVDKIPGHLPYVFFDSIIPETACISTIGQDAFKSGILSGKLMHTLTQGGGCIAVVRLLPEDFHIDGRVNGFEDYFRDKPAFRIAAYDADGGWDEETFQALVGRMLSENADLRGIYVTNVCVHKIAEQISALSKDGDIRLIGYDLIEENVRYLKEGVIDYLISQRPEIQGYQGIYALYNKVVLLGRVREKIMMPLDIVTRENIEFYLSIENEDMQDALKFKAHGSAREMGVNP
jgi:LacI family transcriptional regulator